MLTLCLTLLVCGDFKTSQEPLDRDWLRQTMIQQKVSGKVGVPGFHYLPHLPINEQFLSSIIIRSDSDVDTIDLQGFFVDENGNEAPVNFAIGDSSFTGATTFTGPLTPLATTRVLILGSTARSLQLILIATVGGDATDDIDMEVTISRYNGNVKNAIVSLGDPKPTKAVRFNFHTQVDAVTNEGNMRGFALMNTSSETCSCNGLMLDQEGNQQSFTLEIPTLGKWLGLLEDLAPEMNFDTNTTGSVLMLCDQEIASLGLQFEGANMGGVSIKREQ